MTTENAPPEKKPRTLSPGTVADRIARIRLTSAADAEQAASDARQHHYQQAERRIAKLLESLPDEHQRAVARAMADAAIDAAMVVRIDDDAVHEGIEDTSNAPEVEPKLSARLLEPVPEKPKGSELAIDRSEKQTGSARK